MPKPKDELLKTDDICGTTHARGSILMLENEIKIHRDEIFRVWEQLKENANFTPFSGFSPKKTIELAELIGGHFWCIEQYREVIEAIKTQWEV